MKKHTRALITTVNLAFLTLLTSTSAFAQVNIVNIYFDGSLEDRTLGDYVSAILRASVLIAAIIAFLLIIGGGITIISSAGNPERQQQGKSAITAGGVGLLLVFSAFWIIQLLEILLDYPGLLNTGL